MQLQQLSTLSLSRSVCLSVDETAEGGNIGGEEERNVGGSLLFFFVFLAFGSWLGSSRVGRGDWFVSVRIV